jgi:transposase
MMQSQHSSQVKEAIITLSARGYSYKKIAKSINNAALGPISKGTVYYNVKKI